MTTARTEQTTENSILCVACPVFWRLLHCKFGTDKTVKAKL
jgi:hypothetical protein